MWIAGKIERGRPERRRESGRDGEEERAREREGTASNYFVAV